MPDAYFPRASGPTSLRVREVVPVTPVDANDYNYLDLHLHGTAFDNGNPASLAHNLTLMLTREMAQHLYASLRYALGGGAP